MSDLRTELSETIDVAEWEWLMPHVKRDAVIVISLDLDLLDVGEAIANDNIPLVQRWIDEELISKPSNEQLGLWNSNQQQRFNTLIIQPYVLVQEIAA